MSSRIIFIEDVPGFENEYTISDVGTVYSKRWKKLLIPTLSQGYYKIRLKKDRTHYYVGIHRLLAQAFLANPEGLPYVDHIDRDSTNNSLSNLRWVTCQQNSFNSQKRKGTTSKYKGVSFHKRDRKWMVNIGFNGKQTYIGAYASEEEAAIVYNTKAKELFGEFAVLNEL